MHHSEYSSVDPTNGNLTWDGPLSRTPSNHVGMPAYTEAYLPGYERGHINASSLGGSNEHSNIAPQHHDLNHGGYRSVEIGETKALNNQASIDSVKMAIVSSHPGDMPTTFTVNDTVTYADGHTESIYHSFTNESSAVQNEWNNIAASLADTYDAPNPGDALRDEMVVEEYADLMEQTDKEIMPLSAEYASADFSGVPSTVLGTDMFDAMSEDLSADSGVDSFNDSLDNSIDDGLNDGLNDGLDDGLDF